MSISVSINAGKDERSSNVSVTGSIQHIINDTERTAFNIQDAALKKAVATYFGKAPDDAYVCSPTPWKDLYKRYDWPQVQTLFSVVSASILGVTSKPVIVASQTFENTSNVSAEFDCAITQEVSVTAESNWSNASTVEVGQTISYGISFLGAGGAGETSLGYSQTWEQGGSESESVTLGTSSGVTVTLQPGESVESELTASRGKLTVQIVYQQTLSGFTAINYGDRYQGHHFWALDINDVMSAAGYPTAITTTETIEIDYYANSKIVLKNPQGQSVASFIVGPRHAEQEDN